MHERTHVDLFTGIGGFSLASRANGIRTVAMCERDERCRAFLGKAWPGVEIDADVRTFDGTRYAGAFLLTAGVPCQPASRAGKQGGASDDRWLWPEALRVLSETRPTWAVFENPDGIADVGLDGILSDVERRGYEVQPVHIPACAVDAPHRRGRYWILCRRIELADADQPGRQRADAEPGSNGLCPQHRQGDVADAAARQDDGGGNGDLEGAGGFRGSVDATAGGLGQERVADAAGRGQRADGSAPGGAGHADQCGENCPVCGHDISGCDWWAEERAGRALRNGDVADTAGAMHGDGGTAGGSVPESGSGHEQGGMEITAGRGGERRGPGCGHAVGEGTQHVPPGSTDYPSLGDRPWSRYVWLPCADGKIRRAPDDSFGLVDGLHRSVLAALGNSIVPQEAEAIIRAIVEAEEGSGA